MTQNPKNQHEISMVAEKRARDKVIRNQRKGKKIFKKRLLALDRIQDMRDEIAPYDCLNRIVEMVIQKDASRQASLAIIAFSDIYGKAIRHISWPRTTFFEPERLISEPCGEDEYQYLISGEMSFLERDETGKLTQYFAEEVFSLFAEWDLFKPHLKLVSEKDQKS